MVLEQLGGLECSSSKTKDEEEEERRAVLQHPLEICLKYSIVHTTDASMCPFVQLQPGVAALHEYADWITELKEKQSDGDCERSTVHGGMIALITQSLNFLQTQFFKCINLNVLKLQRGNLTGIMVFPPVLLGHWYEVWTLCKALWGRLDPTEQEPGINVPGEYKQQMERRQTFSAWLSQGATYRVDEEVALAGKGRRTDAIFSYLSGNRISEACEMAQKDGEFKKNVKRLNNSINV